MVQLLKFLQLSLRNKFVEGNVWNHFHYKEQEPNEKTV
jgi:hypothetical protein